MILLLIILIIILLLYISCVLLNIFTLILLYYMMFYKNKYNHDDYLNKLIKIPQLPQNINTLYNPYLFYKKILNFFENAQKRIFLVTLYLEKDIAGTNILEALYTIKKKKPFLEILIFVDWHRAQRNRIGDDTIVKNYTNINWYKYMAYKYITYDIPIYGIPINTKEIFGVLHLKGFIIDDYVIYTSASINNSYLCCTTEQYRYDRYKFILNKILADSFILYLKNNFLLNNSVYQLNNLEFYNNTNIKKYDIRILRNKLRTIKYEYSGIIKYDNLSVIPLVGIGTKSFLNSTIHHLICSTKNKLILCTPYFNLPNIIKKDIKYLLKSGKKVEIIVGDKTTNDFYTSNIRNFKMINIIPYLYEINLRIFIKELQYYINKNLLVIKVWKNQNHSFHIKGIWVDKTWQLLTGNNLNIRSWILDLENALLIYDPKKQLIVQTKKELLNIYRYTTEIYHYSLIQKIYDYPSYIKKRVMVLRTIRILNILLNLVL